MTNNIRDLYFGISGVKQDFKDDWKEDAKKDWKVDWASSTAPVNTVAVSIAGSPIVGHTLTATPGTWTGSPAPTETYQWRNDSGNISGATALTYVVQAGDVGKGLAVTETATNSVDTGSVRSNILGPATAT
jgi:hypothetical protein